METIKDMHFGLMPPHEHQNHTLRDMDTLLQEMKHLNADHMPEGLGMGILQRVKNAVQGTDKKDNWVKGDFEGKRTAIQQVMCELAVQTGGWPEDSLNRLRLSLQSNSDTASHIPATKSFTVTQDPSTKKYTIQEN
jgi:hypothetical protein